MLYSMIVNSVLVLALSNGTTNNKVTIDLVTSLPPKHLCIVSAGHHTRHITYDRHKRIKIQAWPKNIPEKWRTGSANSSLPLPKDGLLAHLLSSIQQESPSSKNQNSCLNGPKDNNWKRRCRPHIIKRLSVSRPAIGHALQSLSKSLNSNTNLSKCINLTKSCQANIILPSTKSEHITCTENSLRVQGNRSVFIQLNTDSEDAPKPIRKIVLRDNIVTIEFAARSTSYVATVIGGHYTSPNSKKVSTEQSIRIELIPKCERRRISIPHASSQNNAKSNRIYFQLIQSQPKVKTNICHLEHKNDEFYLSLPYQAPEQESHLIYGSIEPKKESKDNHTKTELNQSEFGFLAEIRWSHSHPPTTEEIKAKSKLKKLSFIWKRHCLYNSAIEESPPKCPEARLRRADIECKQVTLSTLANTNCAYQCGVHSKTEIQLPETIEFSTDKDKWHARLKYSGELLDDYLHKNQRYIRIVQPDYTSHWLKNQITHISLGIPNRDEELIIPFEDTSNTGKKFVRRIKLPGTYCSKGDLKVAAKYNGDLPYRPEDYPVKNGVVTLDSPAKHSRRLDFSPTFGVGMKYSTFEDNSEPAFVMEFGGKWKVFPLDLILHLEAQGTGELVLARSNSTITEDFSDVSFGFNPSLGLGINIDFIALSGGAAGGIDFFPKFHNRDQHGYMRLGWYTNIENRRPIFKHFYFFGQVSLQSVIKDVPLGAKGSIPNSVEKILIGVRMSRSRYHSTQILKRKHRQHYWY